MFTSGGIVDFLFGREMPRTLKHGGHSRPELMTSALERVECEVDLDTG